MTRCFVFPGQGSQVVGMGKRLAEADTAARHVFEEVDDALGIHLSRLMFEGPEEDLTLTENAQPALMAVSMAIIRILEASGVTVDRVAGHVAGHSLGEYTALTAAKTFAVADAARLLRTRGQAMQSAVPVGEGAMAAILGLDIETAKNVASEAEKGDVCVAANDNADGQVVLSGHRAAIERAIEIAKEKGARRAMLLNVSAPFHCPLMAPAAEVMRDALADVAMASPTVPLIANVTADTVSDPEEIRTLLVEQVTGAVRWRESVAGMKDRGITELVEVGAGKVLSGLVRRIDRDLGSRNIETPDDIDAFIKAL